MICFASAVAFSVKVSSKVFSGLMRPDLHKYRIRWIKVDVFPVPAPARIISGAGGWVIALSWLGFALKFPLEYGMGKVREINI
jgi:hypothetical protein